MSLLIQRSHNRSHEMEVENSCLIGTEVKNIVPVFAANLGSSTDIVSYSHMNRRIFNTLNDNGLGYIVKDENFPKTLLNEFLIELRGALEELITNKYSFQPCYIVNEEQLKEEIVKAVGRVKNTYNSDFTKFNYAALDNLRRRWGNLWKYDSLFKHFWSGVGFTTFRTRDPRYKYVVGRYYIAHMDNTTGATTPLVCLVTQKRFLEMITLSYIMEEPIDSKYLQLWVHEKFDVVRTEYKTLRPRFRKEVRKPMEALGIKVVMKPNLYSLFNMFQGVPCSTMAEYNEFLKDSSIEILAHLREKENCLNAEELAQKQAEIAEDLQTQQQLQEDTSPEFTNQ